MERRECGAAEDDNAAENLSDRAAAILVAPCRRACAYPVGLCELAECEHCNRIFADEERLKKHQCFCTVSKPMCFSSFLAKRTHPRQRQPHYSTPLRSSSSSPALPPHHRSPPTQSSGRHVVPRSAPTASRQVTTSSRGLSSTFASPEASQRKLRATATSPPPPAITTAALSISDNDAEEDDGTPTPEEVAQTLEEKLTQIVGMKPIKDMLRALMLDIQMNLLREQMIEENESISAPHNAEHRHQFQQTPHLLLLGNPGTGKTTIARIIGNLLHKLGVVNSPLFVEVSRESLVAGYIGKTAEKTLAEIEKARGGMMFVDEAYRLVPSSGTSSNDFGREALETIMTEMTRCGPAVTLMIPIHS
eukprot:TRINITY_DN2072_c0_g1_i4.p1 TRINITY_DN2072_c0_g1~~TRINITY_DN2072_c0_g1_i4.p1  ORF type:complete len:362 (+),score=65.06 TRINITY_DN2072_c0_g1_i4:560-1645(+)